MKIIEKIHANNRAICHALAATILVLVTVPSGADTPAQANASAGQLDPKRDYALVTNQDGKLVTAESIGSPGCVLTQTQVDPGGDRDLDVWECLHDNPNPGVDQRTVLRDINGDYLSEKSDRNRFRDFK